VVVSNQIPSYFFLYPLYRDFVRSPHERVVRRLSCYIFDLSGIFISGFGRNIIAISAVTPHMILTYVCGWRIEKVIKFAVSWKRIVTKTP